MKTIADRTKEAREDLQLSQVELAVLAKVSPGTIGNLEAGTRKNPRELLAIAAALRVQPEWLKSGRGPREIAATEAATPYSENLALSPMERDMILAFRKLPSREQSETVSDVMHRAETIDNLVERALAERGIQISGYAAATRTAETLPAPPQPDELPKASTYPPRQLGDPDVVASPAEHTRRANDLKRRQS